MSVYKMDANDDSGFVNFKMQVSMGADTWQDVDEDSFEIKFDSMGRVEMLEVCQEVAFILLQQMEPEHRSCFEWRLIEA